MKREEAGIGRMRCLRQSGSFFRWRAQRDLRHHWMGTRAASASQYPLDDFLGTEYGAQIEERGLRTDMLARLMQRFDEFAHGWAGFA